MPSQDKRVDSRTGIVPIPGFKQPGSLSRPLPAEEGTTHPLPVISTQSHPAPSTDQLPTFPSSQSGQLTNANFTRVLTTTLPRVSSSTTSQRIPVTIKGSMKKLGPNNLPPASHRRRRLAVTLLGLLILILVGGVALLSTSPLAHDIGFSGNPQAQPGNTIAGSSSGVNSLIAQATATAVFHQQNDGYGGGAAQLVGNGSGSLNWPIGQCTYWANYRYHVLTNHWVSWSGNADQWVIGARAAGWNVSSSPHVHSIIVLMPWIQGAYGVGHVAVVESIVAGVTPVTVHTSNMNFYANGGGWDVESFNDFYVQPGSVYFIWHK